LKLKQTLASKEDEKIYQAKTEEMITMLKNEVERLKSENDLFYDQRRFSGMGDTF